LEEYEIKKGDGHLSESTCKEAIADLIGDCDGTIIILDALDECDLEVREKIVEDLIFPLLQQKRTVKVLVTSRIEEDIARLLGEKSPLECPRWTISMQNHEDIKRYIQKEVQRFDPAWRDKIQAELVNKAGGM
jgi:hypothetical protein